MIDRDTAFRPISKEGLDEILALGEFLERLEFKNWGNNTIGLLDKVEKIIKKYKNLLTLFKDGKDSQSFQVYKNEKTSADDASYFLRVHNQLEKLYSFKNRERELRIIAIFLQKNSPPDDLLKLENILKEYHHKLEKVRDDQFSN